jgi:hypothetical protein
MDNTDLRLKEAFGGERMPKGRVTTDDFPDSFIPS